MLKKCALALTFLLPLSASAVDEIDVSCGMSVRSFFEPLIQNRLINPKPAQVEQTGSINHFRPKLLKRLTAYGMTVKSVFGYANEPLLFMNNGNGNQEVYGVIVSEGIANVQAQLNSVGNTDARTFRTDSNTTIIMCKGL
ncbi:hypothetical protein [Janthinobacterium sp. PSPC3-1]|uniref:hypothetical protein n=1 Tax=Janthinobacterium sp. PSPC3-1 TaxID=2804653 RepID=UPI003CE9F752